MLEIVTDNVKAGVRIIVVGVGDAGTESIGIANMLKSMRKVSC